MKIAVDYEGLAYASDHILKLKNDAISVGTSLEQSLGMAASEEREVIRLLQQICTETFPEMIESSRRLIQAIITEFRRADDVSDTVPGAAQNVADAAAQAAREAAKAVSEMLNGPGRSGGRRG